MINKVKEFEVNDAIMYQGILFRIESFPRRTSVILRNVDVKIDEPSRTKISVSKLRREGQLI